MTPYLEPLKLDENLNKTAPVIISGERALFRKLSVENCLKTAV